MLAHVRARDADARVAAARRDDKTVSGSSSTPGGPYAQRRGRADGFLTPVFIRAVISALTATRSG